MRPFSDAQVAEVQKLLDDNYSRHGKLQVDEEKMKAITTSVLGIDDYKAKDNFMFWDCRSPTIGLEFKKLGFEDPTAKAGKSARFTGTRTVDKVPTTDAQESIAYIVERYNAAIDQFSADCGGNIWFAGALYSEDTLVYYHEHVEKLDTSHLVGKWDWSRKNGTGTYNLYVRDRDTGEPVFTYLTKGEKLELYLPVPPLDEVHVFKARQTHRYDAVPVDLHEAFLAEFGGANLVAAMQSAIYSASWGRA